MTGKPYEKARHYSGYAGKGFKIDGRVHNMLFIRAYSDADMLSKERQGKFSQVQGTYHILI